jgi:hypothetical protein
MTDRLHHNPFPDDPGSSPPESDVVEISLLLPGWQMDVLERAAHDRGLTAAAMVRQLLRSFIVEMQTTRAGTREPAGCAEAALGRPAV